MSLTGWPFLTLVYALALLCLVAVYALWSRWPRRLAGPARVAGLLAVMAMGALVAGAQVNRSYDFYASVGDLFGHPAGEHALAVPVQPNLDAGVQILTADWARRGRADARRRQGETLEVILYGVRSRMNHRGLVYLPAAYFDRDHARLFPVLELFHGFPGSPVTYLQLLSLQRRLETEIDAGRIPPMVVVIPQVYEGGRSSECVNAVHGAQFETYLAVDVYDDMVNRFRVSTGRTWAAMGISTGGFCAVNLALHHPERYAAAASLSGYFTAGEDPGTARLYHGSRFAKRDNSPLWWVQHHAPDAPPLYLFASGGDRSAMTEARTMAAALARCCRAMPSRTTLAGSGGHNWGVWSAAFAPAVDWLAQYLPAPLAPPLVTPSQPLAPRAVPVDAAPQSAPGRPAPRRGAAIHPARHAGLTAVRVARETAKDQGG